MSLIKMLLLIVVMIMAVIVGPVYNTYNTKGTRGNCEENFCDATNTNWSNVFKVMIR